MSEQNKFSPQTYEVIGNHPILSRPDKKGMTFKEAIRYSESLCRMGFDGVTIREEPAK